MSVLCTIGWHKWKPRYRWLVVPQREQLLLPWVPALFAGPPFLRPTGIYYTTRCRYIGDQCVRCKQRRA